MIRVYIIDGGNEVFLDEFQDLSGAFGFILKVEAVTKIKSYKVVDA